MTTERILDQDDLRRMPHTGPSFLHSKCHESAGLWMQIKRNGTHIEVTCWECREHICNIGVALSGTVNAHEELVKAGEELLHDLDTDHDGNAEEVLGTIRCTANLLRSAIQKVRGEV